MKASRAMLSFLLLPSLLAGCTAQGDFPSLAPRAVELDFAGGDRPLPPCLPGAEQPEAEPQAPSAPASDAELIARVAQLRTAARDGDAAFDAALGGAATAVSGAGEAGSDSWIAAQVAISEAEMARTPTTTALAELTQLMLEESAEPGNPLDRQAVEQATEEVRSLADRQAERLDGLKASLSVL